MVVGRSRSVVVCVFGGGMGAEKGGGEWEGGREEGGEGGGGDVEVGRRED